MYLNPKYLSTVIVRTSEEKPIFVKYAINSGLVTKKLVDAFSSLNR
jgi:hypothetical protein